MAQKISVDTFGTVKMKTDRNENFLEKFVALKSTVWGHRWVCDLSSFIWQHCNHYYERDLIHQTWIKIPKKTRVSPLLTSLNGILISSDSSLKMYYSWISPFKAYSCFRIKVVECTCMGSQVVVDQPDCQMKFTLLLFW